MKYLIAISSINLFVMFVMMINTAPLNCKIQTTINEQHGLPFIIQTQQCDNVFTSLFSRLL